ncbi:STAS/SEC14 domain-containing protein [Yoonia litorea]|uniref:SpoIIAA-like n=1 Tax=Yoonia litorea TaxID=1123755 RepID=A0A1I6MVA0_9RHOB|nr:STAS/SEC14 domain-containing protein [Yoonia litorea]SFS19646.1 SpoIIAA-like [Yoonia litorea]
MFKITKKSDDRVDIDLSGQLDSDMMAKGLDELITQSEGVTNGKMLYRITSFAMPSFGAIGVEMARLPKLFGLLGKYDRCAVLTDAGWIRTAAEVEGALIPGLSIKAFGLDDLEEAEAWLDS